MFIIYIESVTKGAKMISITAVKSIEYYTKIEHRSESLNYYSQEGIAKIVDVGLLRGFEDKNVNEERLKVLAQEYAGRTRLGFDITFSAPKEVSTLYALTMDERILQAHSQAVKATLERMQEDIYTRDRSKEAQALVQVYVKGQALAVEFTHLVNRNQEPQIHSHVLLFNKVMRETDNQLRAIEAQKLFENQKLYDAIYKSVLVERLRELGYNARLEVKLENGEKFLNITFGNENLKSFAESLSSRRQEVLEKAQELESKGMNRAEAESLAAKLTREEKREIDIQARFEELKKQFESQYEKVESLVQQVSQRQEQGQDIWKDLQTTELVREAISILEKNESVNRVENIEKTVIELAALRGVQVSYDDVRKALLELKSQDEVKVFELSRNGMKDFYVTSKEQFEIEKQNLEIVNELKNTKDALYSEKEVEKKISTFEKEKGFSLSQGQKEAVMKTLTSQDGVIAWQGVAGAGKTTAMELVSSAFQEKGYTVIGLAPTGKAAEELAKSIGEANTVHAFLQEVEKLKENFGTAYVNSEIKENLIEEYQKFNSVFEKHKNLFAGNAEKLNIIGKIHEALTGKAVKTETLASQIANLLDKGLKTEFDRIHAYTSRDMQILTKFSMKDKTVEVYTKNTKTGDIRYFKIDKDGQVIENRQILNPQGLITEKHVFIVDESSMLSSKQANELLSIAKNSGARIVFVGDISQLQAVEAGRFFADVQKFSNTEIAKIAEIQRQKTLEYRELTQALAEKDFQKAVSILEKKIQEIKDTNELMQTVVQDYVQSVQAGRKVIVVTRTNENREKLSQEIRQALKEHGFVQGKEVEVTVYTPRNISELEKRFASFYQKGDIIRFNSLKDVKLASEQPAYPSALKEAGKEFRVTGIDMKENALIVTSLKNEKISFKLSLDRHHHRFSVFEEKVVKIAAGERIMTLQNDRELKVKNGQIYQVKEIKNNKLVLETQSGKIKEIDLNQYRYLDYAYAMTVHKSQGTTVDKVIHASFEARTNYNEVYTALTRGKYEYSVYAIDKQGYLSSFQKEQEKTSSVEFDSKQKAQIEEFQKRLTELKNQKMNERLQYDFVKTLIKLKDSLAKTNSKKMSLKEIDKEVQKHAKIDKKIIEQAWNDYMREKLKSILTEKDYRVVTDREIAKEMKVTIKDAREILREYREIGKIERSYKGKVHESKVYEVSHINAQSQTVFQSQSQSQSQSLGR